jgi:hypothetical protein
MERKMGEDSRYKKTVQLNEIVESKYRKIFVTNFLHNSEILSDFYVTK